MVVEEVAMERKKLPKLRKIYGEYLNRVFIGLDYLQTGSLALPLCLAVLRAKVRGELALYLEYIHNPAHALGQVINVGESDPPSAPPAPAPSPSSSSSSASKKSKITVTFEDLETFFATRQQGPNKSKNFQQFQNLFLIDDEQVNETEEGEVDEVDEDVSTKAPTADTQPQETGFELMPRSVALRHLQYVDPWPLSKSSSILNKPRPEWQRCVQRLVSCGQVTLRGLLLPRSIMEETEHRNSANLINWEELSSALTEQHEIRTRAVKVLELKTATSLKEIRSVRIDSGVDALISYIELSGLNCKQSAENNNNNNINNNNIDNNNNNNSNNSIVTSEIALEEREARLQRMREHPDIQREQDRWWHAFGLTLTASQLATANQTQSAIGNEEMATYSMLRKTRHLAKLVKEEQVLRKKGAKMSEFRKIAAMEERTRRHLLYEELGINKSRSSKDLPIDTNKAEKGNLEPEALKKNPKLRKAMTKFKLLITTDSAEDLDESEKQVDDVCLNTKYASMTSQVSLVSNRTVASFRRPRSGSSVNLNVQSKVVERMDERTIRDVDRRIYDTLLGCRSRVGSTLVTRGTAVDFLERLRTKPATKATGGVAGPKVNNNNNNNSYNSNNNNNNSFNSISSNRHGRSVSSGSATRVRHWMTKEEWLDSLLELTDFWSNRSEPQEYALFLKNLLLAVQSGHSSKRAAQAKAIDRLAVGRAQINIGDKDVQHTESLKKPIMRWPRTMGDPGKRPQAWSFGIKRARRSVLIARRAAKESAAASTETAAPPVFCIDESGNNRDMVKSRKKFKDDEIVYAGPPSDFYSTKIAYHSKIDGNRLPGGRESCSMKAGFLGMGVRVHASGIVPYREDYHIPRQSIASKVNMDILDRNERMESQRRLKVETTKCIRKYMNKKKYELSRREFADILEEGEEEEDERLDGIVRDSEERGESGVHPSRSANQREEECEQQHQEIYAKTELIRGQLNKHRQLLDNLASNNAEAHPWVLGHNDEVHQELNMNHSTDANSSAVSSLPPWWQSSEVLDIEKKKKMNGSGKPIRPSTANAIMSTRGHTREKMFSELRENREEGVRQQGIVMMESMSRQLVVGHKDRRSKKKDRGQSDSTPLLRRRPRTAGPLVRPAIQAVRGYVDQPRQWSASRLGRA